jgi:hypothetical protein
MEDRWQDREITSDTRIDHEDPRVRSVAERLHRNESTHLHLHISENVCVYCALRATHAVREIASMAREADR